MASQRMQSWKALEPGSKHYPALESMLITIVLVLSVCALCVLWAGRLEAEIPKQEAPSGHHTEGFPGIIYRL